MSGTSARTAGNVSNSANSNSRRSFPPLLPSQLRAEQHADARNVTLTGKLMSVRHYSVRGGEAPRTQLVLAGEDRDAYVQVVVFRSPPPRGNPRAAEALTLFLGKHVIVGPVTLRRRNPTFDSTTMAELTGFANESSMRCTEASAALKAAMPQVEALSSFMPALTPLDNVQPGRCVNVLAVARGPAKAEEEKDGNNGNRALWLVIDDGSSGIGAETVVRIADGGCPTDAYALDSERLLRSLQEGDAVLLTDVIADICVDPPSFVGVTSSPCLMLRSWGPTRAWSGIKNAALLDPLRRRLEGAGGPAESRGCTFDRATQELPSCATLDFVGRRGGGNNNDGSKGGGGGGEQRACVWGTVDGIAMDRFPYVKLRAVRRPCCSAPGTAEAPPAEPSSIAWATAGEAGGDGGERQVTADAREVEGEEEQEEVYDVVTSFSEAPSRGLGFRWTTRAAAMLMGVAEPGEFGRLDPSAQSAAASDAIGKGVVMRVWVTADNNAIVTDARVFSREEAAPAYAAAAAAASQRAPLGGLDAGDNGGEDDNNNHKKPRLMTATEAAEREGGGCLLDM